MNRCTFNLHRWGKWTEVEKRNFLRLRNPLLTYVATDTDWDVVGIVLFQERACTRCGKKQLNQQQVRL